jgi:4-hydroxy-2-oxoheptanedioate aldolase
MGIAQRGLKAHVAGGGKVINGWCSIPSTITAEALARQGFDTITVDLQHGLIDYQTALTMLQAIQGQNVPALCRVPWNEPGMIGKMLDAGFVGVICPMINTREEAERFASACRYAPRGARSFGPTRAMAVHGSDYAETAQEFIAAYAMIETAQALTNLDAILDLPEIDGVYIGPSDLGLSLGCKPTLMPEDQRVIDAIETIRSKTKVAGKTAGIHCGSGEMVRDMLDAGFDLGTLLSDLRLFTNGVATELAVSRAARAPKRQASY